MAVGTTSRDRVTGPVAAPPPGKQTYYDRWLKTWVILLGVVILVVVVYLVVITNSLASINKNLGVASSAVTGAGGNVLTLPDQIERANTNLTGIDTALKPIDGNAGQIIEALTSIQGGLTSIDGSLKDTSGSLVTTNGSLGNTDGSLKDTTGSLVNTADTLESILRLAGSIRTVLVDADDPPDRLGVQNIHRRVAVANGVLAPARGDLSNILGNLRGVNGDLLGICESLAVQVGGGGPNC
jgi:hypothetical protein